jgi:hypothetical protein
LRRLGIARTGDFQRRSLQDGAALLVAPWLPIPIQVLSLRGCDVSLRVTMSLRPLARIADCSGHFSPRIV